MLRVSVFLSFLFATTAQAGSLMIATIDSSAGTKTLAATAHRKILAVGSAHDQGLQILTQNGHLNACFVSYKLLKKYGIDPTSLTRQLMESDLTFECFVSASDKLADGSVVMGVAKKIGFVTSDFPRDLHSVIGSEEL
jgi:hypothetical protein